MAGNGLTQSLIFTLFGDYIHYHGDRIRIRSLIKLLSHFGVSEQAVRTTVSRMTRRGWLSPERSGKNSYYVFTSRARETIEEGITRILQVPAFSERWNHCWHLVTYSIPEERRDARDQFRRELGWLGYGMLTNTVWVSPRNRHARVEKIATALNISHHVQAFSAQLEGFMSCEELAARGWNLDDLNADYAAFIEKFAPQLELRAARRATDHALDDAECFTQRFMLIHQYRRFPYRDPYLPIELLPKNWRGIEAAQLFRELHQLLAEPANRYFESVYA